MEIIKMKAESRKGTGKSVAVRLRRGGHIPAVAYGKGVETLHLAVSPKELLGVLKSEHGKNSVVELGVAGSPLTVLVRDYSYHPVSRDLLHVDFIHIKLDEEVDVEVPFVTFGKCAGVVAGGQLRIVFRMLPIRCLPEKIPTKIEYDVTNVQLNEAVHASQVALPEGVKIRLPDEQTVASVVAPEREKAEDAAVAAVAAVDPKAAAAKVAAPAAKPDAKKKLGRARRACPAEICHVPRRRPRESRHQVRGNASQCWLRGLRRFVGSRLRGRRSREVLGGVLARSPG